MSGVLSRFADEKRREWRLAAIAVGIVLSLLLAVCWSGAQGAVSIWAHSSSYNHCFLILPIFFWMVWSGRDERHDLFPRPLPWGGIVILAFAGLWLVSLLAGVAEGVQFAIVGMAQGVLLTLLGWRVYARLLLPFAYLWLLVPSGEFLVPTLQLTTAKASAWLLDAVGIATFRDGIGIEVPSGAYVVAPGCAGLNFVLAALATSVAFAEMLYRGWRRRLAFVSAMLALAVGGNILRVFLIIAIAHLTDNVGNIADDHIFYGWAFFSLLLLGAMVLGRRFRQDLEPPPVLPGASLPAPALSIPAAALLCAVLVAVAPVVSWLVWPDVERPPVAVPLPSCGVAERVAAWPDWPARVRQVDGLAAVDCGRGAGHVHLAVAVLGRPVRHAKLIGVERWVSGGEGWSRIERTAAVLRIGGHSVPVQADLEGRGGRRRLIWSLFWAGGAWRTPGLDAAVADLRSDLAGHRRTVVVLAATEAEAGVVAAEAALRRFLESQSLDRLTAAESPGNENRGND